MNLQIIIAKLKVWFISQQCLVLINLVDFSLGISELLPVNQNFNLYLIWPSGQYKIDYFDKDVVDTSKIKLPMGYFDSGRESKGKSYIGTI